MRAFDEEQCDVLITPTCFTGTFKYSDYLQKTQVFDEKDFFTSCANIAGLPAITVPCTLSSNGLPVGIQFISKWKHDNLLLNISNWFINKNPLESLADNKKFHYF